MRINHVNLGKFIGWCYWFFFRWSLWCFTWIILGGKISNISSSNTLEANKITTNFALSLIILSAKLSKTDGRVSKEELIAVKEKLQIPDSEIDQVARFNKAKDESTGYEPYAKQISEIFKSNQNVLEEVINILFYITEADGHVSNEEESMIANLLLFLALVKINMKASKKLENHQTN